MRSFKSIILEKLRITKNSNIEIFVNNDEQVSLKNASDTGVTVAQKVLPSVVGITVTYQINSIFDSFDVSFGIRSTFSVLPLFKVFIFGAKIQKKALSTKGVKHFNTII